MADISQDGNIGAGNLTPLGLFFIIFGIGESAHDQCVGIF